MNRLRHIACLLFLTACGHEATAVAPSVAGSVVSTSGHGLANAQITLGGRTVTTDSDGSFSLTGAGDANGWAALRVKAAGYPEAVRRVRFPESGSLRVNITLAPIDQSRSFQIPTGTQTITFNVNHRFAGAKLTIPGDSLVDPNGVVVSGTADINLTFWAPDDNMDTAPGVLRAAIDGDPRDESPVSLLSYGMVDIDVRQNGAKLQVAPGKTLDLVFQTTAARRDAIATRPPGTPHGPTLWTLNPNTGLWDEDTGDSRYDMTTGELVAVLRHLSTKNADEPYTITAPPTGTSSCIQGKALGACGQPLPNAQIHISVIVDATGNEVGANYTYVTDSTGQFKLPYPWGGHDTYFGSADWNGHHTDMTQSPHDPALVWVTDSRGTPPYPRIIFSPLKCSDVSGACQNPTCTCFNDPSDPGGCMEALEAADPAVDGYSPCWANPLGNYFAGACYNDTLTGATIDSHYNTVWENHTLGDLCSNCWPLLDMVFKDVAGDQTPGCTGAGAYGTGCCPTVPPPGSYNVCDDLASSNRKLLGEPCTEGKDTCCPVGAEGALLCSDFLCVPAIGP